MELSTTSESNLIFLIHMKWRQIVLFFFFASNTIFLITKKSYGTYDLVTQYQQF